MARVEDIVVRGTLTADRPLDGLTWLRVGGPADWLFQPADEADLAAFLAALDPDVAVFPMGVGSNLIVRDGGIRAVVIRLGRGFNGIAIDGACVTAGAAALDAHVARKAAEAGRDLTFLRTIPGSIGGAVRMNAGAFGGETRDRLVWAEALDRQGGLHRLTNAELGFAYRKSALPDDWIVVRAAFALEPGEPTAIGERMAAIKAEREAVQPIRVATGGSTFKNPEGERAWQLIDAAGCRGLRHGAAMVSDKHCNFLINTGGATAAELEALGEIVRDRVAAKSGIRLEWEIKRLGEASPDVVPAEPRQTVGEHR